MITFMCIMHWCFTSISHLLSFIYIIYLSQAIHVILYAQNFWESGDWQVQQLFSISYFLLTCYNLCKICLVFSHNGQSCKNKSNTGLLLHYISTFTMHYYSLLSNSSIHLSAQVPFSKSSPTAPGPCMLKLSANTDNSCLNSSIFSFVIFGCVDGRQVWQS